MLLRPVEALLQECVAARKAGVHFPDLWRNRLKHHPLITGPLIQRHEDGRPLLEVRLTTGERLVCRRSGFSVE